ncbi:hypothetical protein [Xaviernesmea oryzae]|uniref:hypothetical protein n=1 Tax=Xaviernesmea oryzae TaxID=464029 RepID=UPI001113C623|nr:hypothetical protein [Xaviernesmea oryzae]
MSDSTFQQALPSISDRKPRAGPEKPFSMLLKSTDFQGLCLTALSSGFASGLVCRPSFRFPGDAGDATASCIALDRTR